jgi:uncharacterized membrane protein YfcA
VALADTFFSSQQPASAALRQSAAQRAREGRAHNTMLLDPQLILELTVLGLAVGFIAGLLGIGGAMLMVPAMSVILGSRGYPSEHTAKMAVATSLATICFTSLSSLRAHQRRKAVLWPVVRLLAPGIIVGSLVGAHLAVALPGKVLGITFAVFVALSATQMLLDLKPKSVRTLPGPAGTFGMGSLIGVVSALVGAGGAFISVPFMTWCNVKIHDAVGTSAALGFPIAAAGTAGYVWAGRDLPALPGAVGYLYLPGLVIIAIASMAMAPLGARTAHRMNPKPLRSGFAVVLYFLAAYLLLR